jgi:hypothetical protein
LAIAAHALLTDLRAPHVHARRRSAQLGVGQARLCRCVLEILPRNPRRARAQALELNVRGFRLGFSARDLRAALAELGARDADRARAFGRVELQQLVARGDARAILHEHFHDLAVGVGGELCGGPCDDHADPWSLCGAYELRRDAARELVGSSRCDRNRRRPLQQRDHRRATDHRYQRASEKPAIRHRATSSNRSVSARPRRMQAELHPARVCDQCAISCRRSTSRRGR